MTAPQVSIIMNCLNCARDLPEALASVRAQTFEDYEIIFWDNASSDDSGEIARAFGSRLRYFRGRETVPLGKARNLAIEQAKGEYIAFLDCDDLWRPAKLKKQMDIFERKPAVGLVCTDTEIFDGKRVLSRVFERARPGRGMVFEELMTRQWISMSSAVVRRKALAWSEDAQWFDERLNVCEEADVFYRIAHDWELDYIDEPLTIWRVSGQNTTFRKFGQFACETMLILDKHRKLYPGYDERHPQIVRLLTQRAAFQQAVALWKDGKNAEARKIIGPHLGSSAKLRLFWLASYLPGAMFEPLARLYFALPKVFGR